jgi:hypothetical protein
VAALVLKACSTKKNFQLHRYTLSHFDYLLVNDSAEDVHSNDEFAAGVPLMNLGYHGRAEGLFDIGLEMAEEVYARGNSACKC